MANGLAASQETSSDKCGACAGVAHGSCACENPEEGNASNAGEKENVEALDRLGPGAGAMGTFARAALVIVALARLARGSGTRGGL